MKDKRKIIIYSIIFCILSLIILIAKINSLFILLVFIVLLGIYFVRYRIKKEKIIEDNTQNNKKNDIVINTDLPPNFDIISFKKEAEDLFINMQIAFSNLDYEKISDILCNEICEQFKKQMMHLQKNNKLSIRENIEIIDFKINSYANDKIIVSIGVYEDKYTKYLDKTENANVIRYEDYYEVEYLIGNGFKINNLRLLNSRTKKN